MNLKNDKLLIIRSILIFLKKIISFIKTKIEWVNENSEGKYSPTLIGLLAGVASILVIIIILFVPPFIGMADDGSFSSKMNPVGIYHKEDNHESLYFNYYVREYLSLAPQSTGAFNFSIQKLLIYTAKSIDWFFTRDNVFDLRFLALLYSFLFIPAVILLVKQSAYMVKTLTEMLVVGMLGVLIFADVGYIAYFSSFYTEPIIYLSTLFCCGAALAIKNEMNSFLYLVIFTVSGVALTTVEKQCSLLGVFLVILAVRFIFINKKMIWKLGCVISVVLLVFSIMLSLYYNSPDYTVFSKYHAMTRGVLLQSTEPEKTLREFGIDSSYSILTDTSSNEQYPLINPNNKSLQKGFYDRYNSAEIAGYYARNPKSMIAMLDIAVKAAFNIRGGSRGNYEEGVGWPKMAKSLFWSGWSNFKINSAPKTIGFLVVLLIGIILLFRRKPEENIKRYQQTNTIPLGVMLVIFLMGISQAIITIINSGDAEMYQHLFLFSVAIDITIYFCFSQLLHRLKIF